MLSRREAGVAVADDDDDDDDDLVSVASTDPADGDIALPAAAAVGGKASSNVRFFLPRRATVAIKRMGRKLGRNDAKRLCMLFDTRVRRSTMAADAAAPVYFFFGLHPRPRKRVDTQFGTVALRWRYAEHTTTIPMAKGESKRVKKETGEKKTAKRRRKEKATAGGGDNKDEDEKTRRDFSRAWRRAVRLQKSHAPILSRGMLRRLFKDRLAAFEAENGAEERAVMCDKDSMRLLGEHLEEYIGAILRGAKTLDDRLRVRERGQPADGAKPSRLERKVNKAAGSHADVLRKSAGLSKEEQEKLAALERTRGHLVHRAPSKLLGRYFTTSALFYHNLGRIM